MNKSLLAALITTSAMCSGCGINSIQTAEYEMTAQFTNVLTTYEKRTESVEKVATILSNAKAIDPKLVAELANGKESLRMISGKAVNEPSNTIIRDIDGRFNSLSVTENEIMRVAEKMRKGGDLKFGANEGRVIDESMKLDRELVEKIKYEKAKYLVYVRSFNEIIDVFPASITAKIIREEPRIALSMDGIGMDKKSAGKLVDAATGKL